MFDDDQFYNKASEVYEPMDDGDFPFDPTMEGDFGEEPMEGEYFDDPFGQEPFEDDFEGFGDFPPGLQDGEDESGGLEEHRNL